jgi:hypothetical protein
VGGDWLSELAGSERDHELEQDACRRDAKAARGIPRIAGSRYPSIVRKRRALEVLRTPVESSQVDRVRNRVERAWIDDRPARCIDVSEQAGADRDRTQGIEVLLRPSNRVGIPNPVRKVILCGTPTGRLAVRATSDAEAAAIEPDREPDSNHDPEGNAEHPEESGPELHAGALKAR